MGGGRWISSFSQGGRSYLGERDLILRGKSAMLPSAEEKKKPSNADALRMRQEQKESLWACCEEQLLVGRDILGKASRA